MRVEKLSDIQQYQSIVERYRRQGCLSNDYLQARAEELIAEGRLFVDCQERNAYLLEDKGNCYRMYYYLNDLITPDAVDVVEKPVVVEILYRGGEHFPVAERDYLLALGFEENLIRDQYAAVYKDLTPAIQTDSVKVREAEDLNEVAWACQLFNDTFDPYSGDFIADEELQTLFHSGQVLMAVDGSGITLGALHQTMERNVAWISHVAVVADARGRHVGQALVDAFIERNHTSDKSRYMLWVQQQNTAAVAMYEKKGFRYLNKSTLSLIRKSANF